MENKKLVLQKKAYIAPKIEVVKIEIEQNIFAGSAPDMPGEDW